MSRCENYQKLWLHEKRKVTKQSFKSKGHAEEMRAWSAFLRGEAPHPLPYEQARTSMLLTFAVLDSIRQEQPIAL